MQMLITLVAKILDEVLLDVCNYWETDLLAGHKKGRKALRYPVQKLNILPCLAVILTSDSTSSKRTWTSTRAEQITLDDALVAPANRLKIGKSNIRLSSDLKSKKATLQVVYDVLKLTPFYKAFKITTDVPEIYMQEQMLQICPKLHDQAIEETIPFEEEILTFLRDLVYSGEIKVITDVNVNKLHQPWRSFAAVISKFLSGKSTGYDSL
ncbi:hypothetical protein Tco_1016549 [Tanacetum coccineum]|uniref:Uncharacterized protein n=1 Tax=Tanacetum coccineum TaxID=301880 RepID=A0ABQ5FPG4_9ASTR